MPEVDTRDGFQGRLARLEQEKERYRETTKNQLYEIEQLDNQLRELRSLDGWLFHKKGMRVFLGVAALFAGYKKGSFNPVTRHEQRLKRYLRNKVLPGIENKKVIFRKQLLQLSGYCKREIQKRNYRVR